MFWKCAVLRSLKGGAHNLALCFEAGVEVTLLGAQPKEVEVLGPNNPGSVLALQDARRLARGRLQGAWEDNIRGWVEASAK